MKEKNWNIDTLKEHLESLISSNDRRYLVIRIINYNNNELSATAEQSIQ